MTRRDALACVCVATFCLCALLAAAASSEPTTDQPTVQPQTVTTYVETRTVRATRAKARDTKPLGPKRYARTRVSRAQWPCLHRLWQRESGWNHRATNPSSGAYGIPQALPGHKMRAAGRDWRTNPRTQIRWGLNLYIKPRYGTPCAALAHFNQARWY